VGEEEESHLKGGNQDTVEKGRCRGPGEESMTAKQESGGKGCNAGLARTNCFTEGRGAKKKFAVRRGGGQGAKERGDRAKHAIFNSDRREVKNW